MTAGRRSQAFGVLGALAFAALALASGLDRISADDAELALSVPAPFDANASRVLAGQALAANDPATALPLARRAIARSPGDVRPIAMWAQAQLLSGNGKAARGAFVLTDAMGWREPSTQIYWMLVALERKDFARAADRIDAVLRQAPKFEQRDALLRPFEGWPEGRRQLAKKLAARPGWRDAYFQDLKNVPEITLYMRGEVAKEMGALEGDLRDCRLVSSMIWLMPQKLGYDEAYDVWQSYCNGGVHEAVADSGFERTRLTDPLTPFDWRFPDRGDVDILIGPSNGFAGNTVAVSSTAPGRRVFARQLIRLEPGTYRVSWREIADDGSPSSAVTISVGCTPDDFRPLGPKLEDRKRGLHSASLTLPAGCYTQWLDLAIAGNSQTVTLDDLQIAPFAP